MIDLKNGNDERIAYLEEILRQVSLCKDIPQKLAILNQQPEVISFYRETHPLYKCFKELSLEGEYVVKSVAVIGQANELFHVPKSPSEELFKLFFDCIEDLIEIENFYDTIGGIIGYHLKVLHLMRSHPLEQSHIHYAMPQGFDLTEARPERDRLLRLGIEALPKMGEVYPIGGAGERLNLVDETSGNTIPVALLSFCGRSLLSGLMRDVQAKEFLYFKLFQKQIHLPVAMMTSHEHRNHEHIVELCQSQHWYGRPFETFKFFTQGRVPVVSQEGRWLLHGTLKLFKKPGGHGVIWKQAADEGVFDWFKEQGTEKLLVRQINNPMAGLDDAILVLIGLGCSEHKSFGFASCARLVGTPEGVNVLAETLTSEGYTYSITNIEYTEFTKLGIADAPMEPGGKYSAYPANTNILFADIEAVEKAVMENPIPGVIINMKSTCESFQPDGSCLPVKAGRLEAMMQNIADMIVDRFPCLGSSVDSTSLKTFMTYNHRIKTISVTKTAYHDGKEIHGTPLGCYYDLQANHHEIFTAYSKMQLPKFQSEEEFLREGPRVITLFHPALGPCWEIIGQKIRGGKLEEGAEMQLEIADLDMEGVVVRGSLLVHAYDPLGETDAAGLLRFSERCGKCTLKNVVIENKGVNRLAGNVYWKNVIQRYEVCRIILHGHSEFYAENIKISGNQTIEVPHGYRLTAYQEGGLLSFLQEKIEEPTWTWRYRFDINDKIRLSL